MAILYTTKEAFENAKKWLDANQYNYEVRKGNGGYIVEVKEA